MSCTALRELLIRELGQEDATRFSDVHLQNLIDKGYTDHEGSKMLHLTGCGRLHLFFLL